MGKNCMYGKAHWPIQYIQLSVYEGKIEHHIKVNSINIGLCSSLKGEEQKESIFRDFQ